MTRWADDVPDSGFDELMARVRSGDDAAETWFSAGLSTADRAGGQAV